MLVTILVFLLVLSVLVLVHEFGHFLVAKKLGIKVEEFGFGFPPRLVGKKIGETVYSINWLPIGGFVKLYGEDDAGGGKISRSKKQEARSKDVRRAFFARPVWQRAAVVLAGVVMNFLLAVVIISYLFSVVGVTTPGKDVLIVGIIKDSPAERAGLHQNDTILSVNGKKVSLPLDVTKATKQSLGRPMSIVIKDTHGQTKTITLTPRLHYPANQGAMGVAISLSYTTKKYPWYQAPFAGTVESVKESGLIIEGLGSIVSDLIVQRKVPAGVAGPVGIAELTGQTVKLGFEAVLSLVSLLSLNLAVVNVLPFPALDGGRLFFIIIEAITRKKVNAQFEAYAHTIGMIILLSLVALLTIHDILRHLSGQPLIPQM